MIRILIKFYQICIFSWNLKVLNLAARKVFLRLFIILCSTEINAMMLFSSKLIIFYTFSIYSLWCKNSVVLFYLHIKLVMFVCNHHEHLAWVGQRILKFVLYKWALQYIGHYHVPCLIVAGLNTINRYLHNNFSSGYVVVIGFLIHCESSGL